MIPNDRLETLRWDNVNNETVEELVAEVKEARHFKAQVAYKLGVERNPTTENILLRAESVANAAIELQRIPALTNESGWVEFAEGNHKGAATRSTYLGLIRMILWQVRAFLLEEAHRWRDVTDSEKGLKEAAEKLPAIQPPSLSKEDMQALKLGRSAFGMVTASTVSLGAIGTIVADVIEDDPEACVSVADCHRIGLTVARSLYALFCVGRALEAGARGDMGDGEWGRCDQEAMRRDWVCRVTRCFRAVVNADVSVGDIEKCVSCEKCAFTYSADHKKEDGTYSCPLCELTVSENKRGALHREILNKLEPTRVDLAKHQNDYRNGAKSAYHLSDAVARALTAFDDIWATGDVAPVAHDPGHPHLIDGEFQSDKYPTTPRGKVPLSVKDPSAQDLLFEYARRRRSVDAEFSDDLVIALTNAGYVHKPTNTYYPDNPEFDATDAAHPAWHRGSDHTCEQMRLQLVKRLGADVSWQDALNLVDNLRRVVAVSRQVRKNAFVWANDKEKIADLQAFDEAIEAIDAPSLKVAAGGSAARNSLEKSIAELHERLFAVERQIERLEQR